MSTARSPIIIEIEILGHLLRGRSNNGEKRKQWTSIERYHDCGTHWKLNSYLFV